MTGMRSIHRSACPRCHRVLYTAGNVCPDCRVDQARRPEHDLADHVLGVIARVMIGITLAYFGFHVLLWWIR